MIESEIERHWDDLIRQWADSETLPLFCRKHTANRGSAIRHESGRIIIPVDNSPAQWAFVEAYRGLMPKLGDIDVSRIPIAMAFKKEERLKFTFRTTLPPTHCVNKLGWSLNHKEPIGMRVRGELVDIAIERLKEHFRLLMAPSNMVLSPVAWGLGKLIERYDSSRKAVGKGGQA